MPLVDRALATSGDYRSFVLEALREPLEDGCITISRANATVTFPARFQLIAAMNPCPQGYSCDGKNLCRCTPQQQLKHRSRISAPFLDRIDIHIEVPRIDRHALDDDAPKGETSKQVRERVLKAYQQQKRRGPRLNAELEVKEDDTQQHHHIRDGIRETMKLILNSVKYRGRTRSLNFKMRPEIVVPGDIELKRMKTQKKKYGKPLA